MSKRKSPKRAPRNPGKADGGSEAAQGSAPPVSPAQRAIEIIPPTLPPAEARPSIFSRIRRILIGKPRDPTDRSLFHRLSLVAFLAWVGLGADGLSSAAYGPAEAFLALGEHKYLALVMALVVPLTVLVIATVYSRIIEAFPRGGGGYVVATKLLGPGPGLTSGCALVIDYVLTITVSIAAAGEAIFSMMPTEWHGWKLPLEVVFLFAGVTINIRGVKDAVLPLVPIFVLFLVTHALLIGGAIARDIPHAGETARQVSSGFQNGWAVLGLGGMFVLFIKAYSLGAGTYTGIEAVSNGLYFMREPRVQTGKQTMRYMAISLAITASGLLIAFLLAGVEHEHGKTLNAVLTERVAEGIPGGGIFIMATLIAEAAILVVAAQTGFIGGPRVLASMAVDGWVPRRFAGLSDRLTNHNGITLMGLAALIALIVARGHVPTLVVMYTINVFISFTLSMAAMLRRSIQLARRRKPAAHRGDFPLFIVGLCLCLTILVSTSITRFTEGAWVALALTGAFVALCAIIRSHYDSVNKRVERLQKDLRFPDKAVAPLPPPFDKTKPTAAILVGGYSGLGIHTMLQALASFGGYFKNAVFVTVGVIDSDTFKGEAELAALRESTEKTLQQYVELANRLGVPAEFRFSLSVDPVDELEKLCLDVFRELPKVTFFAGQLIFQEEKWHHRFLHNQTAYSLQRRLQWEGIPMLILPIRVR